MTKFARPLGSGLFALSLTAIVVAQAPPRPLLNLRMGLWEVTSTTKMSGMPGVDTSKMPPEQRAKIAAMMSALAAKPTVAKSCMTREKFVTDSSAAERPGTSCQQTIQTNTPSLLENTMTCTGERPSKAVSRTEAQSPTAFTATVTSTSTAKGREMGVTIDMTGKWLSADCGDVK